MPKGIKRAIIFKLVPAIIKRYNLVNKSGKSKIDNEKLNSLLISASSKLDKYDPTELAYQAIKLVAESVVSKRKATIIISLAYVVKKFLQTIQKLNPVNIASAIIIDKIASLIVGVEVDEIIQNENYNDLDKTACNSSSSIDDLVYENNEDNNNNIAKSYNYNKDISKLDFIKDKFK